MKSRSSRHPRATPTVVLPRPGPKSPGRGSTVFPYILDFPAILFAPTVMLNSAFWG